MGAGGEPVRHYEADKVYLIDFPGARCGPCVKAIPHLTLLHDKFAPAGLIIIGISVTDPSAAADESFVTARGSAMPYRVACDAFGEGAAHAQWFGRALPTMPYAFAVRNGKVLWHGVPTELGEPEIKRLRVGQSIESPT